jgi:Cu+-exporting ATPase
MRVVGPVVDPFPCSGCGQLLDPLRAGHVAILDLRMHYFCNRGRCRAAFLKEPPTGESSLEPSAVPSRRPEFDAPVTSAFAPREPDESLPELPSLDDDRSLIEPIATTILSEEPPRIDGSDARDMSALLIVIGMTAGALTVALALAGDARFVIAARLVLAVVGVAILIGRAATSEADVADPHPLPLVAPSILALVVAVWAAFGADRALASEAASLSGIIVTASALSAWLVESARGSIRGERAWIGAALAPDVRRGLEATDAARAVDARPGDQVLVEAGEIVPVDLVVSGSDVDVFPWNGATRTSRRRDGDAVVAGAKVARGRLRGTCTWAGDDRAYARLVLDPRRRGDALAPLARASRVLVERWAVAAAFVGAIFALLAKRSAVEIAMTGAALYAAFAAAVTGTIVAVHVSRGILLALRRGIVYRSADAWDRAGRVALGVFCARGTLLLGEPEVTEIESPDAKLDPRDLLAFAAGAERAEEHPVATAVVRAARARGIRPEGVRNIAVLPGFGVTAVTSSGEELCVGNRMLLIEQRISIALAEPRLLELEGLGRTVVLVALGRRLVGIVALQDGLRPGARAAVQHLLDAEIEPVLMSADSREACEAIGRSLDVEHVRPEVAMADRNAEVRRMIESGASVAVLGHPRTDHVALASADVGVALSAAGSASGDYAVALCSDDVRDAALALALARSAQSESRVGLALALGPALLGAVTVVFGFLPVAFAPLATLVGSIVAVVHARALDRSTQSASDSAQSEAAY